MAMYDTTTSELACIAVPIEGGEKSGRMCFNAFGSRDSRVYQAQPFYTLFTQAAEDTKESSTEIKRQQQISMFPN